MSWIARVFTIWPQPTKYCSHWITPASIKDPIPCYPADRHDSNGAWVSFGTDGGFVHLVSPAGAVDAAMACTTRTVHTFAQLVKISFEHLDSLQSQSTMHSALCESYTKHALHRLFPTTCKCYVVFLLAG